MRKPFLIAAAAAVAMTVQTGTASAQSCDAYARDYASRASAQPTGNVVGGALLGGAVGAIIGGAAGGGKNRVGNGAAIGAGVGALGGAVRNKNLWNRYYQQAYNDCVARSSAYRQPVRNAGGRAPWSPAWYSYCSRRYKTFNPETGYFHAGGGRYVFCR